MVLTLGFVEDLGLALVKPRELIAIARVEKRGVSSVIPIVAVFSVAVFMGLIAPLASVLKAFLPPVVGVALVATLIVVGLVAGFVLWIVDSALMHLLSLAFGGRGCFPDTAIAVGYSYVATWPIPLFALASIALGPLGYVLIAAGVVIEVIWRFYSLSHSLSEAHGYSALRGLAVVLLTRCIVVATIVVLAIRLSGVAL